MSLIRTCLIVAGLLQAMGLSAGEELEIFKSGWLEQQPGYLDATIGVQVREVEEATEEGGRSVTLAIPKDVIEDTAAIEEVVVVGRMPEEPEPLMNARVEWLKDLDDENYGLLIHLGKEANWPLRLYMSAEHGYLHLDSTRLMDPSLQ